MCVVLQHILARETLRSPVASLSLLVLRGYQTHFAPLKRITVLSLARGDFALLLHLHRPTLRGLDARHRFRRWITASISLLDHDQGCVLGCVCSLGSAQTRHNPATPPFALFMIVS